jgi:glucan-binding YG repeat protein
MKKCLTLALTLILGISFLASAPVSAQSGDVVVSLRPSEQDIELTGLQSGTKYHYYLEVQTTDKTYTTSAQSFTTKREADSGTSSQSSSNKNSSSSNNTNRGTNSTGTGTTAKNNTQKKNEWSFENGKWYYYGEDGFSKVGWFQVGTKWYYTVKGTNELLMNCWKNIGGSYYYFDPSGAMYANQWVLSNGKWYWMGSSGTMLCDQNIDVGGVTYLLAPDGTCVTDEWVMKDGQWQYYKPASAGLARNENFIYDGKTYYADANGFVR